MKFDHFRFGLESEFFLVQRSNLKPLWHPELNFRKLDGIFQQIDIRDLPSIEGDLFIDPPHEKNLPFIVEGYHAHDAEMKPIDMQPKGVEIRTPVMNSVKECLDVYKVLFHRMQSALAEENYLAVALSHHPTAVKFSGPQDGRTHEFWQWAMEVMTTYGPDINISLPISLHKNCDFEQLSQKINYYGPALAALTLCSPFAEGELWKPRTHSNLGGDAGKSFRTFRRSIFAPAVKFHPESAGRRIEFKLFEMTHQVEDFEAQFLMVLALLLDQSTNRELKGRAWDASRIYELGQIAVYGLDTPGVYEKLGEFFEAAHRILPRWGFSTSGLSGMIRRWQGRWVPSDQIIEQYLSEGHMRGILLERSKLMEISARIPSSERVDHRDRWGSRDSAEPVGLLMRRKG